MLLDSAIINFLSISSMLLIAVTKLFMLFLSELCLYIMFYDLNGV